MSRLVVDARLAGHSGIGTYLDAMLPRVSARLPMWRPLVLARSALRDQLAGHLGGTAEVREWDTPALSVADLFARPPGIDSDDLLWTPHFNVPRLGGQALAVTLHDILPLTAPALAGFGRSLPVRWWMSAVRSRARVVFCVSSFTRSEALRHCGLDAGRVRVTPLGVGAAWRNGESCGPATRSAPPTMIFVGLLKPHKNVARLLRAFASVRERIPHVLVLVGRHRDLRHVDREALSLAAALGHRVELVEQLPLPELVARVRAADFAVLPSLHEGFGLPALEAMAVGTPVLAGCAGALPEVCGNAALYCDPLSEEDIAARLVELATDAALRARLSVAGRARAGEFSWEACADATAAGLDSALAAPERG